MAWRAQVDQLIGLTADGEFSIQVDYYDDADPANAAAGLAAGKSGTASASTDLITITAHGFAAGDRLTVSALTGGSGLLVGDFVTVLAAGLTANVFAVTKTPTGTAVNLTSDATAITVRKFTAPASVLWSQAWDLPNTASTLDLQNAVVQEGQKARAWIAARDGARATVPVGTNIAIP
jgi:hypothetical protein